MVAETRLATLADFERFIHLPENADRRFEYIGGEIVEVVSNSYSSVVAVNLSFAIKLHLRASGQQGYVTGADGGYVVGTDRYAPDVGFVARDRLGAAPREAWVPIAPDLAVEVLSPTDDSRTVRVKIITYLAAGTVVWLVDPAQRTVEVYTAAPQVTTLHAADPDAALDGGDVLPGFHLPLAEIFPE